MHTLSVYVYTVCTFAGPYTHMYILLQSNLAAILKNPNGAKYNTRMISSVCHDRALVKCQNEPTLQ